MTDDDHVSFDGDEEKDEIWTGRRGGEKVEEEESEADLRKEDGGVQGRSFHLSNTVSHCPWSLSLSLPGALSSDRISHYPVIFPPPGVGGRLPSRKLLPLVCTAVYTWCMRSLPRPLQEVDYLRTGGCPMTPALCSYNCSTMQLCPFLLPPTTPLYSLQLTRSGTFN